MINFAHRGYSGVFPDNTILAFKEAIKLGATGIELDVHKSRDGELVVIHDERVDRLFFGRGYVKDYNYFQLRKLKQRKIKYIFRKDCYMPKLREVVELIKDKNIILNIEMKNNKIQYDNIEEDVIKLLKEYNLIEKSIISSFNHKSLLKCKEICNKIKTGMLYSWPISNLPEYAKEYKVDALHPSLLLVNELFIQRAHKNNLLVNVYTVNDKELMSMLIKWQVDGIITDCPRVLEEVKKGL